MGSIVFKVNTQNYSLLEQELRIDDVFVGYLEKRSDTFSFIPQYGLNVITLNGIGDTAFYISNPFNESEEWSDNNILKSENTSLISNLTVNYIHTDKKNIYPDDTPKDNDVYVPTTPSFPTLPPIVVTPSSPSGDLPNGTIIDPMLPQTITPTTTVVSSGQSDLYRVYECTLTDINRLANILWSQEYLKNVLLVNTNPIENILSLKMTCIGLATTTIGNITLGNVRTDITAGVVTENDVQNIGTFKFESKYNSFLDCTPFTTYEIYLPFVGFREVNSNDVLNEVIQINMYVDALTLMCKYQLIRLSDNLIVGEYEFYIAVDLPISASNMIEAKMQKVGNLMESVLSIPELDFSGIATGLFSAITTQAHTTTNGTASANTSLMTSRQVFLKVTRPMWQEINLFNHTVGRMCNQTYQLGILSGFTKCYPNNDLSGIPCTDNERDMLENLLTQGIYL